MTSDTPAPVQRVSIPTPAPQSAESTRQAQGQVSELATNPAASEPPPAGEAARPARPASEENASPWVRIVTEIRNAQPALAAVLDHGMPLEVNATTLKLGFPDGSFFGRQAQSPGARESLLKAAEVVLGARPNLLIGAPGQVKVSTLAEIEETGRRTRSAAKREAALSHPAVVDAMEIFDESAASVDVQVDLE